MSELVLSIRDLRVTFDTPLGPLEAVRGVDLDVHAGEMMGVVGESGSGKSVTMMSLLGLLPMPPAEIRAGRVMFDGQDLLKVSAEELRKVRGGKIGFIFQDPMTSLNPVFTVGYQIAEPLRKHMGMSKKEAAARSQELLELVGIPDAERHLDDYPHQFSGGMRQRVMIAIALACDPQVLIADEPTTALDVTVQAQILQLLSDLRQELHMSMVLVTHDLGVVAGHTDKIAVMYAGEVVEYAETNELFANVRMPYTEALLNSIPRLDQKSSGRMTVIEGRLPDPTQPEPGCAFASRCPYVQEKCRVEHPELQTADNGHQFRCHFPLGVAR